jgi:hypothetical protein
LRRAITKRGTSVDDYVDAEGLKGGFQNHLSVYGRHGGFARGAAQAGSCAPSWRNAERGGAGDVNDKKNNEGRNIQISTTHVAPITEEEDQLALEQRLYEESLKVLDEGQVLTGTIVQKTKTKCWSTSAESPKAYFLSASCRSPSIPNCSRSAIPSK